MAVRNDPLQPNQVSMSMFKVERVFRVDDFKKKININQLNVYYDDSNNNYCSSFVAPNGSSFTMWACPNMANDIRKHAIQNKNVFVVFIVHNSIKTIRIADLEDMRELYLKTKRYLQVCSFIEPELLSRVCIKKDSSIKWGIIDIFGDEVLPVCFDNIEFHNKTGNNCVKATNSSLSRHIPITDIIKGRYLLKANPKGILGDFSFVEFLWFYGLQPELEILHSTVTNRIFCVVDNKCCVVVGKSFNNSFPGNDELLRNNVRVLISKDSPDKVKLFLYKNDKIPTEFFKEDTLNRFECGDDNSIEQLALYYKMRLSITDTFSFRQIETDGWDNSKLVLSEPKIVNSKINTEMQILIDRLANNETFFYPFKDTQQKEDRVVLIARLFSIVGTKFLNKHNYTGNRQQLLLDHTKDILRIVQEAFDFSPGTPYKEREFKTIQECLYNTASAVISDTRKGEADILQEALDMIYHSEGVDYDVSDYRSDKIVGTVVPSFNNLHPVTRSILYWTVKIDTNGKPEKDDLGFPRFLDFGYVYSVIHRGMVGKSGNTDFSDILKDLSGNYPWMKQVINKLADDELLHHFHKDMLKCLLPNYYEQRFNNTLSGQPSESFVSYLFNRWYLNQIYNLILDSHSLYGTPDSSLSASNADYALNQLDTILQKSSDYDTDDEVIRIYASQIRQVLRMIGIDFSNSTLIESLSRTEGNLRVLFNSLFVIFGGVKKGLPNGTILVKEYKSALTKIANLFSDVQIGSTLSYLKLKRILGFC